MNLDEAYQILEVSSNINKEDLKVKFKRLVIKFHPDRNKGPGATEKFIQIKDAYDVILKHLEQPIQSQQFLRPGDFVVFENGSYAATTANGFSFTFTNS